MEQNEKKITDYTTEELLKMKEAIEKAPVFKYLEIVNELERRERGKLGNSANIDTIKT